MPCFLNNESNGFAVANIMIDNIFVNLLLIETFFLHPIVPAHNTHYKSIT